MPPLRNRGERPPKIFSNFHGAHQYDRYFYVRFGEILEVDSNSYRMKIRWLSGRGSPNWMPISFPYVGPAGCMGALPEEGAIGIFAFYDEGTGKGSPLPLAYVPGALAFSTQYNTTKKHPDAVSTEDQNIISRKFHQLMEGDMITASALGAQILINKDVNISDFALDRILLRGSDQSIISTSVGHYVFADGASVSAGPAMRNLANLFDSNGNRITGTNLREATLSDGREVIYVVPFGERVDYDTRMYSEYRITADELVEGTIDNNEITGFSPVSNRNPLVTMAMGNYIGGNPVENTYGKILRPVLFASPLDLTGNFELVQCMQNKGTDEISKLGLAYALHFHKTGAFFGVDKEGHYYMHLPASLSNPAGSGRSMSVVARGGRRESWGSDADGNAWDFSTVGGLRWEIGTGGPKTKRRSIDIRTDSSIYFQAGGSDDDNLAFRKDIYGNSKTAITGDDEKTVSGEASYTIDGLRTEKVFGSSTFQCQTDHAIDVLGGFKETARKKKQ